jgi:hypothetical protein
MVREPDCFNALGAATFKVLIGVQTPTEPDTLFLIDNWVSPMLPTPVVSQPQGRGMEQRV